MGECNYYVKARFRSAKAAQAAIDPLCNLLAEGERAYEYWQSCRSRDFDDDGEPVEPPTAAEFWPVFRERFPLVVGYLGRLVGKEDWSDALVGHLGTLVDARDERRLQPNATLTRDGTALRLQLNGIWHFSDTKLLERFFRRQLGAVAVGSVSDESFDWDEYDDDDMPVMPPGFDPFDTIDV